MSWFHVPPLSHASTVVPEQPVWQLLPFYRGIADLSAETLLTCWAGEPQVDDPRAGRVSGARAFADYVQATREWLALSDATTRPVATTSTPSRSVEEVVVELEVGGERHDLGVAVAADFDGDRSLVAIRIYHGWWALPDQPLHLPALAAEPEPRVPGFVLANHRARLSGDLEAVLDSYESDATMLSFGGPPSLLTGREELRRTYAVPDIPGNTPATTLGAVTYDGQTCAVEYQVTRYEGLGPDEAGVVAYERGPNGKIATERRYRVSTSTRFSSAQLPHRTHAGASSRSFRG